jgi:hypothetical protein
MKKFLHKYWIHLSILTATLAIFPSPAQYAVQLYALSCVSMVLLITYLMFDDRNDWGIFPYIDLSELVSLAKKSAIGAAIVFFGICYLVAAVISVTVVTR